MITVFVVYFCFFFIVEALTPKFLFFLLSESDEIEIVVAYVTG